MKISTAMLDIGKNIKRERLNKDYTQEYMGSRLNMAQQTYSNLEQKEELDETTVRKIAEILDVPLNKLYQDDINSNVRDVFQQSGNLGSVFNYSFNPVDKLIEVYEKLLKEKDDHNSTLRELNKHLSGKQ